MNAKRGAAVGRVVPERRDVPRPGCGRAGSRYGQREYAFSVLCSRIRENSDDPLVIGRSWFEVLRLRLPLRRAVLGLSTLNAYQREALAYSTGAGTFLLRTANSPAALWPVTASRTVTVYSPGWAFTAPGSELLALPLLTTTL